MSAPRRPVDTHVGSRIRLRRRLLGLSQTKLGETVGLTFQQIQKYENGAKRVGASRIYQLATALNVPVSFFFDAMPPELIPEFPESPVEEDRLPTDLFTKRETLDLLRDYHRITDATLRKKVLDMVRAMAENMRDDLPSQDK